jgi:hypothetical protein
LSWPVDVKHNPAYLNYASVGHNAPGLIGPRHGNWCTGLIDDDGLVCGGLQHLRERMNREEMIENAVEAATEADYTILCTGLNKDWESSPPFSSWWYWQSRTQSEPCM